MMTLNITGILIGIGIAISLFLIGTILFFGNVKKTNEELEKSYEDDVQKPVQKIVNSYIYNNPFLHPVRNPNIMTTGSSHKYCGTVWNNKAKK